VLELMKDVRCGGDALSRRDRRLARVYVRSALATGDPQHLARARRIAERFVALGLFDRTNWQVYLARIKHAQGLDVRAILESLHARGALDAHPEALQLLAESRREQGDLKGAGKVAVEAQEARRERDARRARSVARQVARAVARRARERVTASSE